jgi:hypothetical protein
MSVSYGDYRTNFMVKTKNMAILGRRFGRNYEPNVTHIFDLEPPISRSLPIMWDEYQKNLQNFVEYQLKYTFIKPIDVKFSKTCPHFIHYKYNEYTYSCCASNLSFYNFHKYVLVPNLTK